MGTMRWVVLTLALAVLVLAGYRIIQLREPLPEVPEREPVRVDVLQLEKQLFASWAYAEGTAESLRKAFLNFEQAGNVVFIGALADGSPIREGVRVFGPGQGVRLGQLLARLDNRESAAQVQALEARLRSARERADEASAQVNIARNNQQKTQLDFERIEKLHTRGLVASNELERNRTAMLNAGDAVSAARSAAQAALAGQQSIAAELNSATVSMEKTSLFAPFDGVITSMNLVGNNYYYPPAGVVTRSDREAGSAIVVVDDSRYEIRLEVPEFHARHIEEGQKVYLAHDDQSLYRAAELGFDAESEGTGVVEGRVWSVSPALSLQRRARLVKVRTLSNADDLRDGMFVRAWIVTREIPDALALPLQALSFSQGVPYVFVVAQDNIAHRRQLSLGLRGLRRIQVTGGLAVGDRVVVRGQHLLTDNTAVKIVGVQ